MESFIQTKGGGFTFALVAAFGGAALLFFGGKWTVLRFSDPTWLKKYAPLFAFLAVTLKLFLVVIKIMGKAFGTDNPAVGITWTAYLLFIAACVTGWRRYLIAHPNGTAEPLPPTPPAHNSLSMLNLDPELDPPPVTEPSQK